METRIRNISIMFETCDKQSVSEHEIKIDEMTLYEENFGEKIKKHIKEAKHNHKLNKKQHGKNKTTTKYEND